MYAALALVLSPVLLALLWAIINPVERWKTRKIPGPPGLPLLGHLLNFATGDATDFTVEAVKKYGNVVAIWFGNRAWITIADPALIRKLGFKFLNRPARMTDFGHVLVGHNAEVDNAGAFVASGEVWRRGRRAFEASIIHPASLAAHLPAINRCANRFVARLARRAAAAAAAAADASLGSAGGGAAQGEQQGKAALAMKQQGGGGGGGVEILTEAGNYTMAAVGEVAYGIDFGTLEDDLGPAPGSAASAAASGTATPTSTSALGAQLVEASRTVFRCLQVDRATVYLPLNLMFPALRPLWRWMAEHLPDAAQTENMRARSKVAEVSRLLMEQWQANKAAAAAAAASGGDGGADGGDRAGGFKEVGGGISSSSFMAAMMEGRRGAVEDRLSDIEVIGQGFTFLVAGYETSSNTTTMASYLLATHPAAQQRMADEIDAVLGPWRAGAGAGEGACAGGELTPELLAKLPYTEAVLQETLRLYPAAPYLLREAREEVDLGGGRVVPKDSVLVLHVHSMQRDPDVWPQPEAFLPQRYLPEGQAALGPADPNGWAPFGVGARMCVGHKLAMMVTKVALVRMYQRFRVSLHPRQPLPLKMKTGLVRVPADGVWLTLTER
ncbi:hypothetical protein CHLRE_09g397734v5 [Chlamydomonas reinhardtii]|uniref:Uncharacterized protein n=1 Tax=Chlamydomonas reinhardtii TaxID=3055 RepID=A8J0I1_CHLRE|nr:uncharacterized protein CHLRE_09g397734v5 [Chlamydomonas reinhardtii]PNW79014.1 hypothetical protein CHLRE_09g397734v5 [Chlamydomonas reinhardtii]|eukprot:XP_001694805.1 cytochrome P450, CYP711 clan [Chlamydomonas reinhardtii]